MYSPIKQGCYMERMELELYNEETTRTVLWHMNLKRSYFC